MSFRSRRTHPVFLTLLAAALLLAAPPAARAFSLDQWGLALTSGQDMDVAPGRLSRVGVIGHAAGPLWQGRHARLELRLELHAGWFSDYHRGWESAATGGLRLRLGCACAGSFYLEAGIGPSYNSLAIAELGTRFNFLSYAGLGVRLPWTESLAWEIGYRVRHLSNAGLHPRNHGVTSHQFLLGVVISF